MRVRPQAANRKSLSLSTMSQWKFAFFFLTHPDRYLHYILTDTWPMTKVLATTAHLFVWYYAKVRKVLNNLVRKMKHFLNWNWKHKCEFKPITTSIYNITYYLDPLQWQILLSSGSNHLSSSYRKPLIQYLVRLEVDKYQRVSRN